MKVFIELDICLSLRKYVCSSTLTRLVTFATSVKTIKIHLSLFSSLFIVATEEITYFFTNLVYSLPHQVFHVPAICHGVHVSSCVLSFN